MRLHCEKFDARARRGRPVIDQDTGEKVGYVISHGVGFAGYGGIDICLFGGKYQGIVNTYNECWAFIKGVETVLNHMLPAKQKTAAESEAA